MCPLLHSLANLQYLLKIEIKPFMHQRENKKHSTSRLFFAREPLSETNSYKNIPVEKYFIILYFIFFLFFGNRQHERIITF